MPKRVNLCLSAFIKTDWAETSTDKRLKFSKIAEIQIYIVFHLVECCPSHDCKLQCGEKEDVRRWPDIQDASQSKEKLDMFHQCWSFNFWCVMNLFRNLYTRVVMNIENKLFTTILTVAIFVCYGRNMRFLSWLKALLLRGLKAKLPCLKFLCRWRSNDCIHFIALT